MNAVLKKRFRIYGNLDGSGICKVFCVRNVLIKKKIDSTLKKTFVVFVGQNWDSLDTIPKPNGRLGETYVENVGMTTSQSMDKK